MAKKRYVDLVTAFDIETTRLSEIDQSFMYIWQWQFGTDITVVGRTWAEYKDFVKYLKNILDGRWLVVWVHNLSYEFQFLRGVYNFTEDEVFAVKSRRVLKCELGGVLEFRCSYLQSNMGLDSFTKNMGVEHAKLTGTFDYERRRYPWTELTADELAYCVHDVRGLVEAMEKQMRKDGDNLYSVPLTSTGYVRRDVKWAMQDGHAVRYVREMLPDYEVYQMLREAFRGGNTHANRWYSGQIIENVHSADRSSSYPDVQCNAKFPMSEFCRVGPCAWGTVWELLNKYHRAAVMRISIEGLRLRRVDWGCPYLSRDKCRKTHGAAWDNGRVLSAAYLETTITDIDLRIIVDEYDFDNISFLDVAHARYGFLPRPLVGCTKEYYGRKTALKGIPGEDSEYIYMKSKNKLNSVYGMSAQDPVKQCILFKNGVFEEQRENPEELYYKSSYKAFQSYAWGVWVTAWARYRLEEGIKLAHGDVDDPAAPQFLYCDTDSVKYTGEIDWFEYNKKRIKDSTKSGAYAKDANGKPHFMGCYEIEHDMSEFITWGAKKYAYREDPGGPLKITVAGVNKKKGAEELEKAGGLAAFKPGFVFREAGGLEAVYNDQPFGEIEVEGHKLYIGPNLCLKPSTYTLGLSGDYARLLQGLEFAEMG